MSDVRPAPFDQPIPELAVNNPPPAAFTTRHDPDGAREHARRNDPHTSKEAAGYQRPNRLIQNGSEKHRLLRAFVDPAGRHDGRAVDRTAEEACEATRLYHGWRRVSDLLRGGYVEPTDYTRQSLLGRRQARVLTITDGGREALRVLDGENAPVYRRPES